MNTTNRIIILTLTTALLIAAASFLVSREHYKSFHAESEAILANTIVLTLRDAVVQDVIDNNSIRVTNLLQHIISRDLPIKYLYVRNEQGQIFAHSFYGGFPRQLFDIQPTDLKPGINLIAKLSIDQSIVYEYAQYLVSGYDATIHIGIDQTSIAKQLTENNVRFITINLAIVLFALILAFVWAKRITTPLSKINDLVKAFGAGKHIDFSNVSTKDPSIQALIHTLEKAINDQQEATLALLESEKDLTITLSSIADAVITTDKNGHITRMNPIAEQLTGWSISQAKDRSLKEVLQIIDASTRKQIANPIDKVISSGKIVHLSNNTTLISKSGDEYQIADSAAPIRDQSDNILGMVMVFQNVTEQYKLRQLASITRRDLQAIMDNSPTAICTKNLEGRYIFCNRKFEQLFNTDIDNVVGLSDYEAFQKLLADRLVKHDSTVREEKVIKKFEEKITLNKHSHRFIVIKFPLYDESDNVYASCSIFTDITDRPKTSV